MHPSTNAKHVIRPICNLMWMPTGRIKGWQGEQKRLQCGSPLISVVCPVTAWKDERGMLGSIQMFEQMGHGFVGRCLLTTTAG